MSKDLYDAAEELRSVGVASLLPLRKGMKQPAVPWADLQGQTTNDEESWTWFYFDSNNLGIITGAHAGLTVIDVDDRQSAELITPYMPVGCAIADTPKGRHFYFKHSGEGCTVRCKDGPLYFDVRGEGGYVVAPPSKVDGKEYKWVRPIGHVSALPKVPHRFASVILRRETQRNKFDRSVVLNGVESGGRNEGMTQLAGYVMGCGVDEVTTYALLHALNEQRFRPPLGDDELQTIVESISRREKKQRGEL